ncbi:MAG: formylmethanofuran dehydrogenase subunit C, partial [Aigarchaeota archaeon]|nr:formylmethanofuran dehydrogenase subunit C [Aigarchaeota archaeon]
MGLRMIITKTVEAPIFGEMMLPDKLAGMTLSEVKKLDMQIGNKTYKLDQVFSIEESDSEKKLVLTGDLSHVRFIGRGMTEGSILVDGKAGPYLGDSMKGGDIVVRGDADSWLGARMLGGTIEVHGNAGDFVGAAYRGSLKGMKRGSIKIHGSCGSWAGFRARGGLIWIDGDAGLLPGMHMS